MDQTDSTGHGRHEPGVTRWKRLDGRDGTQRRCTSAKVVGQQLWRIGPISFVVRMLCISSMIVYYIYMYVRMYECVDFVVYPF